MRPISEAQFQAQVVELAEWLGWRTYHTFDSRRSNPGFPDLTLVRDGRLVMAELKDDTEKPTPEQLAWYAELLLVQDAAPDVFATRIWRPRYLADIDALLAR
jgi:hypothetical protein